MKAGDIVELSRRLKPVDMIDMEREGIKVSYNIPYTLASDPEEYWTTNSLGKSGKTKVVLIEEIPGHYFNACYFTKIILPLEIEKFIEEHHAKVAI